MQNQEKELREFLKGVPIRLIGCENGNELYANADEASFPTSMKLLNGKGFTLISMFCEEKFNSSRFTLFYVFERELFDDVLVVVRNLKSKKAASVMQIFPSASWYEREIMDGFGIEFEGNPDKRRLFLHEHFPRDFHPLLKSFRNSHIKSNNGNKAEYMFKEISGEGVYQIPVGPVHAGIIEPGHFRFSVIGETIYNLEIRMFYKHRGIEKLAEGKTPEYCVRIAESISGDETAANAAAFCMAVEKISSRTPPMRALQLRTIFLEMERIYSHLGDLAGMAVDVAFPVGASPFFILREKILRENEQLTGSRFMKGIMAIGGLRKDVSEKAIKNLRKFLDAFEHEFEKALDVVYSSPSAIDRLETTGAIKNEIVRPLNITGPAARACGFQKDTRKNHPYGTYSGLKFNIHTSENGDVMSRFNVKAGEIMESVRIIRNTAQNLQKGPILSKARIRDGHCLSLVESPRGQSLHWAHIKHGLVYRYKIRTASFCNWQSIEHAVMGNIVPDFPLINKSLNLSYAGTDL
ncbi:NADH-quinone oxidoreductase subunit C [Candidatus Woesearchaeota archaeon]|nr:NADH-quinone oxidoreductase subunit C [Candidatus Woesearchaeota archaeon]